MSFTFTIPTSRFPPPAVVLDALGREDLEWLEDEPEGEEWPRDLLHAGVRERSARGVELSREDAGLAVRILACSSRADYDLGLGFAEAFARACASHVEPEGAEESVRGGDLRDRYGDAWIASEISSGAGTLCSLVARDGSVITVPGFRRDVHFGPKTLARLAKAGGGTPTADAVVETIRRLQWIDEQRWYPGRAFRVSGQAGAAPRDVAAWGEDVASLFPAVDAFVVTAEPVVEVAASNLEAVAGDRFVEWLDDRQALVDAASGAAWEALVARARARAGSGGAPSRRPWWKLWGPR